MTPNIAWMPNVVWMENLVPPVDVDDLKKGWNLREELAALHGSYDFAIGPDRYAMALKPGADVQSVAHREFQLRQYVQDKKLGKPDEAVFKKFAENPLIPCWPFVCDDGNIGAI